MSTSELYKAVAGLGPIRMVGGKFRPNRAQAILVAKHSFMVGYAHEYGAHRGVMTEKLTDDLALGIQTGVMDDCPSVLLGDWYDAAIKQLAIDAMAMIERTTPNLWSVAVPSEPRRA